MSKRIKLTPEEIANLNNNIVRSRLKRMGPIILNEPLPIGSAGGDEPDSEDSFETVDIPNNVVSRTTDVLPFTVGSNDWQGRINFIENDLGEWVFVWTEGTQHSDPSASTARFNIAFSDDEGTTFSSNNKDLAGNNVSGFPLVPQSPADFIGDAQLFKCPNGDLILICQERGTATPAWNATNVTQSQYRSTNHGKTWTYELDFCEAIGLTTTEEKGQIQGNYENTVVGDSIYLACSRYLTSVDDGRTLCVRSDDNAQTWEVISEITAVSERVYPWTEVSLAYLGNSKLLAIARTADLGGGEARVSNDMGLTWGTVVDIKVALGYTGIHQPRTMVFSNILVLAGRDSKRVINDTDNSYNNRSAFWTIPIESINDMTFAGTRRQYLDPYYSGATIAVQPRGDSGYTRFLPKADGSFVFFGYWGTNLAAKMYRYIVDHTDSPSEEDYANNDYFPDILTQSGVRYQMNRDNISGSTSLSPANGGIAVASRAHNTLITSDMFLLTDGTSVPEFVVDDNNKGWMIFVNGRITTNIDLPNLLFKASFSLSFWLWPDDGQPTTAQVLVWTNSTGSTTIAHGLQVNLNTAGTILFRYGVAGTLVTATTASAVFANGATTPKHIAFTVTSGNFVRTYVDGVLQSLDPSNNGNMSTVTMANFNCPTALLIGQRLNGVSYDVPYIGRMREFIIQPVVWTAGDIANQMLN